jgi:hypothetical protein
MRVVFFYVLLTTLFLTAGILGQAPAPLPRVELIDAPLLRLPGNIDSNSPIVWERAGSQDNVFAITSSGGLPKVASGKRIDQFGAASDVAITPWPGGGIWIEAVIPDVDGTWYGYYHNEMPATRCGATTKVIPRIGAVRSVDFGRTWEPLGVILEAPPFTSTCSTPNEYFVGGVGDFSVQLDRESRDLYFFYSAYLRSSSEQGVAVGRLAWADRDQPAGKMMVWQGRTWAPASRLRMTVDTDPLWRYPSALPILPAVASWHDADPAVDAFWGPSVHWNTYLQQYVMLLNRAKDSSFNEEGIYISYSPTLADPQSWTPPVKIMNGGRWYPQIVGGEPGSGTDRTSGQWGRFFDLGTSRHIIRFTK